MQIILTKEEYDELVQKSTAVELEVEKRVDEWKRDTKAMIINELAKAQRPPNPEFRLTYDSAVQFLRSWFERYL